MHFVPMVSYQHTNKPCNPLSQTCPYKGRYFVYYIVVCLIIWHKVFYDFPECNIRNSSWLFAKTYLYKRNPKLQWIKVLYSCTKMNHLLQGHCISLRKLMKALEMKHFHMNGVNTFRQCLNQILISKQGLQWISLVKLISWQPFSWRPRIATFYFSNDLFNRHYGIYLKIQKTESKNI